MLPKKLTKFKMALLHKDFVSFWFK